MPVNTSVASSLPSPVEKVRPVVSPSVSVPSLTERVTCSALGGGVHVGDRNAADRQAGVLVHTGVSRQRECRLIVHGQHVDIHTAGVLQRAADPVLPWSLTVTLRVSVPT